MSKKPRLSGERHFTRSKQALDQKRESDNNFAQSLDVLRQGLICGVVDLTDQRGDLLEIRALIDKSLVLNARGTSKMSAATGHLAEAKEQLQHGDTIDEIANAIQMIITERVTISEDAEAVAAVLDIAKRGTIAAAMKWPDLELDRKLTAILAAVVAPDVLAQELANLPEQRRVDVVQAIQAEVTDD